MTAARIPERDPLAGLSHALGDAAAMTKRNLVRYLRLPQLLVFSTVQPVMFVILFAYVFGGAVAIPGVDYIDFLMPGIFVQAVVFGAMQTGIGLADDLSRGMVDRFRSLPMARSAVLAGRTVADAVRNLFVVLLMIGVGMLIGFRFHAGFLPAVGVVVLAVLLGFAFSWVAALIGLAVHDPEATQAASFVWVFPLIFASSAFVPVATMPAWLAAFARSTPITATVNALRALSLGGPTAGPVRSALLWIAALLVVFVPLSVARYRRSV